MGVGVAGSTTGGAGCGQNLNQRWCFDNVNLEQVSLDDSDIVNRVVAGDVQVCPTAIGKGARSAYEAGWGAVKITVGDYTCAGLSPRIIKAVHKTGNKIHTTAPEECAGTCQEKIKVVVEEFCNGRVIGRRVAEERMVDASAGEVRVDIKTHHRHHKRRPTNYISYSGDQHVRLAAA
jgi:hypothetical protein